MHIELTEMLRCPEAHAEDVLVLSTGEMKGRMVRAGLVGCPVCRREYPIVNGIVDFRGPGTGEGGRAATEVARPPSPVPVPDAPTIQALLELSGPGGFVVLVGDATRHAVGLARLMGGLHFIGINPPGGVAELPDFSLLLAGGKIPLRSSIARGVVVGADAAAPPWLVEAHRVLLRGRRLVVERADPELPIGLEGLAAENGVWVGEKR